MVFHVFDFPYEDEIQLCQRLSISENKYTMKFPGYPNLIPKILLFLKCNQKKCI